MNEIETKFNEVFEFYVTHLKTFIVKDSIAQSGYTEVNINTELPDYTNVLGGKYFEIKIKDKSRHFDNKIFHFKYYGDRESTDIFFDGYVPDFTICSDDLNFIIEIDGHEWHEKTKEQAMRDKQKDRAYIKNGYIPIHFTGSEIFHNPEECVKEVLEIISRYFLENMIKNEMVWCYEDNEKQGLEKQLHFITDVLKGKQFLKPIEIKNGAVNF